jgi:hypothetical protein
MAKLLFSLFTATVLLTAAPSCNSNKITCPTYKDSFPDQKKKKKPEPQMPKPSKTKSGVMPKR